jgi:glycogen(starch) synthase
MRSSRCCIPGEDVSKRDMRILHVLDHSVPLHSGYTFRTLAILRQQRRLGWLTTQLTSTKHERAMAALPEHAPTDHAREAEHLEGFRFHRTRFCRRLADDIPGFGQWRVVTALRRRLPAVIEEFRPDILHAHSPSLNGMATMAVARRLGLPFVYELRSNWEDASVDPASRDCRSWLPAQRVTVVPNAVDCDLFKAAAKPDPELVNRLGLGGCRVLGFIGSFYAYEGLTLLIEALPSILARSPKTKLLLVGGGFQEAELKRRAAEADLNNIIVFTGRVPHDSVGAYYQLIDVLVYPRFSMRLTDLVTPLKPLEAMAYRRLVVASDVGGHAELVRDGETGLLFRAGDAAALAASVIRALELGERGSEIRAAARRFVETERTWEGAVGRYAASGQASETFGLTDRKYACGTR